MDKVKVFDIVKNSMVSSMPINNYGRSMLRPSKAPLSAELFLPAFKARGTKVKLALFIFSSPSLFPISQLTQNALLYTD